MTYLLYSAFQLGSMPPLILIGSQLSFFLLDGLYNDQIQDYMQKISVLTQYIGNLTKFDKIRLKIEADQVCLERNFSKILSRY